jgi:hypothetical protein
MIKVFNCVLASNIEKCIATDKILDGNDILPLEIIKSTIAYTLSPNA